MGAVAVLLCVTVLPILVHRYVSGLETIEQSNLLYSMIAFDATVMYLNYLLTGILYGCQRYHLKNMIAHNLAGEARGTDERMLELLEPYAGQRGRVVRHIARHGSPAPKFGAKRRIMPMHAW